MTNKAKYFDPKIFVDGVIAAMKLGEVAPKVLLALKEAITSRLADRIMTTVIDSFGENELRVFENVLQDHPEMDKMDAVVITAQQVDGLDEKLNRQITSLHEELVYDAEKIDSLIKK